MTTEPEVDTAGMAGAAGTTDATYVPGRAGPASLPATEIAARVQSGELDPVDVVRAHAERIDRYEPALHAFASLTLDSAVREAEGLRGRDDLASLPLAGVPVAIKDNVDVQGLATRFGSLATPAAPAAQDDELVARLRRAGALVVGTTTMPELAIWPFTEGAGREPTRNPWSPGRTPGGSSGGSAVAVATGMAAVALGSDGGGSLRVPAAACGIVGFKPTPGAVPLPGGAAEHWRGCSAFGPLARSVADAALVLDVLAGAERFRDPGVPSLPLTISVSSRHPVQGAPVAKAVKAALEGAASALARAGHRIEKASPPNPPTPQAFIRCWLAGIAEDAERADEAALEPRTRAMVHQGRRLLEKGWAPEATSTRDGQRLRNWLAGRDLLITPVMAQDPPAVGTWNGRNWIVTMLGVARWMGYTAQWNLAGCPTIAVPVGRSRAGMPIGVQLIGLPGSEEKLLAVAAQLEQLLPQPAWVPAG
jgi:amidase